jgi:hypothetical protein
MARKATASIPYNELKKLCTEKGIKSWPEYQKRYTEIPGAKKTLHATYSKEWKGNKAFFGEQAAAVATDVQKPVKKENKKAEVVKTASNAAKKNGKAAVKSEAVAK